MKNKSSNIIVGLCIGIMLIILGISITVPNVISKEYTNCKVTDKESVTVNNDNQYRIYTTCGTFVVQDSVVHFRFDSADVYGAIAVNSTYTLNTVGMRFGLFSMFPNILQFKDELKKDLKVLF